MRRTEKLEDVLILIAAIIALWQGLSWIIGETALTPPLATMKKLAALLSASAPWHPSRSSAG